jgi:uncharacterized protein (TIGR01244 family)
MKRVCMPNCLALLLAAGLTMAQVAAQKPAQPETVRCGTIQKLSRLADIYVGGQPGKEDFAELKKLGIKTILNFRKADEISFDERAVVEAQGIAYVHLPFQKAEELTDALLDKAREVLRNPKNRPVLVHCGSANRAAAVWLAYRVLDDKVSWDQAVQEARTMGLAERGLRAAGQGLHHSPTATLTASQRATASSILRCLRR